MNGGVKRRRLVAAAWLAVLPGVVHAAGAAPANDSASAAALPAAPPDAVSAATAAQEPAPPTPGQAPDAVKPATSAPAARLDEVVVTATKRSQSVRDVPASIDVLTGARLEEKGARDLKDFIDLVPGIKLSDQAADSPNKLAIRGVGPDNTTNQTVGTVIGDISVADPAGNYAIVDPDPWDMQTVEVLKGPQGTLFGASSLAGMIRYVPNAPVLGEWGGKAFGEWVSVKDGGADPTYGAALNVPLGGSLALRASGVVQHDPGLIDIDTANRHVQDADGQHR